MKRKLKTTTRSETEDTFAVHVINLINKVCALELQAQQMNMGVSDLINSANRANNSLADRVLKAEIRIGELEKILAKFSQTDDKDRFSHDA